MKRNAVDVLLAVFALVLLLAAATPVYLPLNSYPNLTVVADLYPGSDCGAKVAAADLAAASGYRIQVSTACGIWTTPVTLSTGRTISFAQAGTHTFSCPSAICLTTGQRGVIEGLPIASNSAPVTIQQGNGANSPALISLGPGGTLHDLLIDGNKANNASALDAVLVNNSNRVHIYNVTIQNAIRDNIHVTNTYYPTITPSQSLLLNAIYTLNVSGGGVRLFQVTAAGTGTGTFPTCSASHGVTCAWGTAVLTNIGETFDNYSGDGYLGPDVLTQNAGRDGFFTERNADWIIGTQVEFEVNGRDGFHCEDCATYRFVNADFGANAAHGFYAAVVNGQSSTGVLSTGHLIMNSQLGGNGSGDIYSNGSAASQTGFASLASGFELAGGLTIVGDAFISAGGANEDAITTIDSGGNTITGNTFGFSPYVAQYRNLVNSSFSLFTGTARIPSVIRANVFVPSQSGPIYSAATPYSLSSGVDVAEALVTPGASTDYAARIIIGSLQVQGAALLPSNGGGGNFLATGGFSSPVNGRIYVGDGSGWHLSFAKRSSGADTDLFTFDDSGNLALLAGGYKVGANVVIPSTASGYTGSGTALILGQAATTSSIGGSPLAAGTCATGTVTLAASATGHPGAAAASDGTVQGNYVLNVSVSATTATVSVCAITAGTPTAKMYNVTVF